MKVKINVLASDFQGNRYMNCGQGLDGCPLERAFTRAGYPHYTRYMRLHDPNDQKVLHMFMGYIPIEDFSFEVEIERERSISPFEEISNCNCESRPSAALSFLQL